MLALFRFAQHLEKVLILGGEVVPVLLDLKFTATDPFQNVRVELTQCINSKTTAELQPRLTSLTCSQCLARFTEHRPYREGRLEIRTTYCGCRICHQSRAYYASVICILDSTQSETVIRDKQGDRINWFMLQVPFDFDRVEIVNATDEEVERFAVQCGNDMDYFRRALYAKTVCSISPSAQLSENSIKVLKQVFDTVEISSVEV